MIKDIVEDMTKLCQEYSYCAKAIYLTHNYIEIMRSDKVDKKRKYPPAYYRYRAKHVTLSILLSNDLRDFLDHYKEEGMTYPEIIKDAFENGKRMSSILEAEYTNRLDSEITKFMKDKDREYYDKLEDAIRKKTWETKRELKESIAQDIANIEGELTRRFNLSDNASYAISNIFQDYGFRWTPSGPEMNFHDKEIESK